MSKNTMPWYRVENELTKATDAAFDFGDQEGRFRKQSEKHTFRKKDIGGRVTPQGVAMATFGALAVIALAALASLNSQNALAGLLDPMGESSFKNLFLIGGIGLMLAGTLFGLLMDIGISKGIKRDQHTGRRSVNNKIWLAIIGFLFSLGYIAFHFFLANSAGTNAGLNNDSRLSSMPFVVAGFAFIEVVIGYIVINRLFGYLMFLIVSIQLLRTTNKMNAAAKDTNNFYREYIRFITAYNDENAGKKEQEVNSNIRKALTYYSGINPHQQEEEQATPVQEENTTQPAKDNTEDNGDKDIEIKKATQANKNTSTKRKAEQAVEEFLKDTTVDENLTV